MGLVIQGSRSPNERGEEEEEEAIEIVESDTACSLWEQKTKTNVREIGCYQNKQIVSHQQDNIKSNTTGNSLRLRPTN